jgi:hypothetical protein
VNINLQIRRIALLPVLILLFRAMKFGMQAICTVECLSPEIFTLWQVMGLEYLPVLPRKAEIHARENQSGDILAHGCAMV